MVVVAAVIVEEDRLNLGAETMDEAGRGKDT